MKRAVIYTRKSSHKGHENYSLQDQEDACREYCNRNEFEVIAVVSDNISGTVPINERPGGNRLWQMIEDRTVEVVVLFKRDRTGRDDLGLEYVMLKNLVYKNGLELHYVLTGKDNNSQMDNLLGYIDMMRAAEEKRDITIRTQRGRRKKAMSGQWVGSGPPPYGYTKVGKKTEARLVVNEAEAAIVREVFRLYTSKRLSLHEIARRLTKRGAITRGKKFKNGWTVAQVKRILDKPCYTGRFSYSGIAINLPDLAIVSQATFDAAKRQREIAKQIATRRAKHEFLLSGMIYCTCGNKFVGMGKVYTCNTHFYRHLAGCTESTVITHRLDDLAWMWVHGLISDDEILERGLAAAVNRNAKVLQPKRDRLETVKDELKKIEARVARAVQDVQNEDDAFTRAEKEKGLTDLKRRRQDLITERDKMESELEQEITPDSVLGVQQTIKTLRNKIDKQDFKGKRWILARTKFEGRIVRQDGKRMFYMRCELDQSGITLPIDLSTTVDAIHHRRHAESRRD